MSLWWKYTYRSSSKAKDAWNGLKIKGKGDDHRWDDLIEIQEAFAVQALADAKLMGIKQADYDKKINVNGSGISLCHPIAATGAMRLITLLYEI
jgi:hypothetical protein